MPGVWHDPSSNTDHCHHHQEFQVPKLEGCFLVTLFSAILGVGFSPPLSRIHMGVSKNKGVSPQIIPCLIVVSIIFTIHFGVPLYVETPIYIYIPGTQITSIFEGQPLKTRPFPIKTRVIWVQGMVTPCDFHPAAPAAKDHVLMAGCTLDHCQLGGAKWPSAVLRQARGSNVASWQQKSAVLGDLVCGIRLDNKKMDQYAFGIGCLKNQQSVSLLMAEIR